MLLYALRICCCQAQSVWAARRLHAPALLVL